MAGNYLSNFSIDEIVVRAAKLAAGDHVSSHIQDKALAGFVSLEGKELLSGIGTLVARVGDQLMHGRGRDSSLIVIAYLPMQFSDSIEIWSPDFVESLIIRQEPPSMYVYNDFCFLEFREEEYKFPLAVPIGAGRSLDAIYRCWRSERSLEQQWNEFDRGFYVYMRIPNA